MAKRSKHSILMDRALQSSEPHEIAYRKAKRKHTRRKHTRRK